MENKKNPKYNLNNHSILFLQLGIVVALFITYQFVESTMILKPNFKEFQKPMTLLFYSEEQVVITKRIEPTIPKAITKVKDDIIDLKKDVEILEELKTPIVSDPEEQTYYNQIKELSVEEEFIEDVPMIFVENAPVFPGCKGNNQKLKDCFNKKIQKHFQKEFDTDLPNELGLIPGRKRVIMIFKIDKLGQVTNIVSRTPHPKIDKEVHRIIELLPKMKPGMQQGRTVDVKYTLPMRIDVDTF